jgi:hypothetical protein
MSDGLIPIHRPSYAALTCPSPREPLMTREDYLMAQALVLAIEVLSTQPGALRQDNNIREMKDCLDRLAVPSNLIAHLQSQARAQIDRLTPKGS